MTTSRFPAVAFFFSCWLVYAVCWSPFVIREHLPAITLAESATLDVTPFAGWNDDVFAGPRGGAFINNNPGASILGAIPLIAGRPLFALVRNWQNPPQLAGAREPVSAIESAGPRGQWYFWTVAFLTAAFLMAPASAFAVTAYGAALSSSGVPRRQAIAAGVLLGFGTPIFLRTGYLNHNLLVCHLGLLAALLIWNRHRSLTPARAAAAGGLAGYAVLCDFTGLLVLGILACYAWLRAGDDRGDIRRRVTTVVMYGLGAAPGVLALAVYQRWAFGNPARPSQHFMTAIAQTSRGYRGFTLPSFDVAWANFFNPEFGLFAVCPILALALAAPFIRKGARRLPARETWVILGGFAAFVLFCASNQYSLLQASTGIRYLVPIIPAMMLLTLQVVQVLPSWLARLLVGLSLLIAGIPGATHDPFVNFVRHPTDFQISWVRRFAEHGVVVHPVATTFAIGAVCTAILAAFWRESWSRAVRSS